MKRIIIFIVLLIASIELNAQDKPTFGETVKYIQDKVKNFSIGFNDSSELKVDNVTIEKNGDVLVIYSDKKVLNEKFNLNSLKTIAFSNDIGNCKCGITLHDNNITFWVNDKKGITIRISNQYSKSVYNAFVHLLSAKDKEDLFADPK